MKLRDLHPNIRLRIGESFLNTMVGSMIFPFMAIYLAMHFGEKSAGTLLLFNVLGTLIAGGLGGFFTDKFGRRKTMLAAESTRFIAILIMAAANSAWLEQPMLTFVGMMMINACAALSLPAVQSMIIDCSDESNRTLIFSTIYWITNLSVLIGSFIGGVLFRQYLFELSIGLSVASLVSLVILWKFIQESAPRPRNTVKTAEKPSTAQESKVQESKVHESPEQPQAKGFLDKYMVVFRDWIFLLFVFSSAMGLSLEFLSKNYSSVRLSKEMGIQSYDVFGWFTFTLDGIQMYGLLIAENAVLVILASVVLMKFTKRLSSRVLLILGVFVCAIGYSVVSVSNTPGVLVLFMIFAALGQVFFTTMKQTYVAKIVPAEHRGTYMAIGGMEFLVASMVGSFGLIIGSLVPVWVMGSIFLGMGLVSTLLFAFLLSRIEQQQAALLKQNVQNVGA